MCPAPVCTNQDSSIAEKDQEDYSQVPLQEPEAHWPHLLGVPLLEMFLSQLTKIPDHSFHICNLPDYQAVFGFKIVIFEVQASDESLSMEC